MDLKKLSKKLVSLFHVFRPAPSKPLSIQILGKTEIERKKLTWKWTIVQSLVAMVMLSAVIQTQLPAQAFAHDWYCSQGYPWAWHWNRYGDSVNLRVNLIGVKSYWNEAYAARSDWDNNTLLVLIPWQNIADIYVLDGNYGDTGWAGLATINSYTSPCHITTGTARLNYYYSMSSLYKQGVFCQEIGHLFGLDHSNTGDCMGLGYYSSTTYYVGPHNTTVMSYTSCKSGL